MTPHWKSLLFAMLGVFFLTLSGCGMLPGGGDEEGAPAAAEGEGQLYTCGMHPQVIQDGEGTCPICGMNLTPMAAPGGGGDDAPSGERKVKYWQAPMDPTFISDKPGKSPMGMDLIPVYEDEAASDGDYVKISPGIIQQIGVETAPVELTTVFRHIRTIGEVEVGEDELSVVNLRYSGWVERIRVERTGDSVKRGQTLFDIYSPELVAAQEEFLLALRTQGADAALTKSARRRLELWDIANSDIDAIAAAGESRRTLPVRSPSSGFVLSKHVVEGARVSVGKDLYRIGNLQRIWVTAEVYEDDAPWVEVDQPAQMELANAPGETVQGKVSYIYPTLNPVSRTLTVRLEFDNPGVRLKPGMFATVYIQYRRMDDVIAVPTEAILYSGRRSLVFVAMGRGRFMPREVVPGLVGDQRMTEIRSGLEPGDFVVTSGQFLIDSESQLQEAIQKIIAGNSKKDEAVESPDTVFSCPMHPEVLDSEASSCPKCGMTLVERPGTPDEVKVAYGAKPGQYTCPMHPEVVSDEPGRCPKCSMFLEQVPGGDADEHAGHDHGAQEEGAQ